MPAPTIMLRQRQTAPSELTARNLSTLRSLLSDALIEHRSLLDQHETAFESLTVDVDVGAERELARIAAARSADVIVDIEHALDRLDDGSFGVCESCGRRIPFERLEAIPHARYCVACPRPGLRP